MDEQFNVTSQLETLASEPNKVAEYYRAFHKANDQAEFNVISDYKKHLPHFDCIQIADGGTTMVCSSNLNGRLWKGSVIIYDSPEAAVVGDASKAVSGTVTSASIADGVFLSTPEDFIVGEDSGAITLMRMARPMNGTGPTNILHLGSSYTHNNMVTAVAVFPLQQKIVTSSYDLSIKIINTDGLIVEQEFAPAHGQPVLCVSTQTNNEVFASCADSKEVLVWDPRLEKAAHMVFQTEINTTCVDWQPGGPVLAIGDQAGNVYLADSRNPKTQLAKFSIPAHRPVHKTLFNKNMNSKLAILGDFLGVQLFDCSNGDLKQTSVLTSHTDFPRGAAWYKKDLYTCGWDKKILKHSSVIE